MTLTELSIKRPTLIVVIFAALTVVGLFSLTQLKYELLPKITPPFVAITTVYPGASPNEVETSVTKLIEDAVSGIDKISTVYGTSTEGASFVSIEFTMSANVNIALQDVQRKVNEVASRLPDGAKTPIVSKFALDELPVLRMGLTANMPSREFYQLVKDKIQAKLAKIAGVGQITLVGGDEREIKVNIDAQKLRSYGLSLLQVTQAIKTSNLDFPTGKVKEGGQQYIVRIAGKFSSVDALRDLVVAQSKQGGDIKLSDIAEIEDGQKEYSQISRIDGKTSIGVLVSKQSDANTVDVSALVRKEIPNIEELYKEHGLKFDIAQDGSTFTLDAANAVKKDLAIAVILVAIVMLAFLHSIRNSVIVMIAIPASLISTFIAMYAFGLTLNLMTLLGLSLVVGILVDDSIVVLENIYRHLEKGDEKRVAALKGRNEIGFAALSITLVDVVVFVPLALVSGLVGNIMREFALTVVFSTLMSLFVSFTITPLLASRFAKLEHLTKNSLLGKFGVWFEAKFDAMTRSYLQILKWGLANRGKVVGITVALLIASFALVPLGFIGSEFIAVADRGEFAVTLELPPGSTVENTNFITQQAERMISEMPEVRKMFVNVGASSDGFLAQSSNNIAELTVTLVPKRERKKSTDAVADEIKQKLAEIPGAKVRANPIGIFGTANQTPIQLVVSGTSYEDARHAAEQVADVVRRIPGTADVRLSSEEGKPETRVEIDRQKMAAFGLNLAEVGQTLRVAFNGDDDSKFRDGDNEYAIRILFDQFDRSKTSDIGSVTFVNRKGQLIELKQFADIYQATGPTKLQRQDRNPSVTVLSQAVGRPSGSIGEDIRAGLAKVTLPQGVTIAYKGDLQNQAEGFASLGLALIAAVLFMYMIMVALYDSYVYPFVVMFSVPVAMIGALLALALTMKSLSIFSILGVIMLVGLVGKNAILLVDRTNQMRAEANLSTFDALIEAGQTRLRPIMMTTVAMVFGMLPIAMSTEAGAEWKSGLAWAIIGGLTSSLLLTLVLVPVVYMYVDSLKEKIPALFRRVAWTSKLSLKKRIPDLHPQFQPE
ncbi:MAG: efflux RND transporter permease subunit [Bacteroidetes bacterium]|nr:efflux RND transporter permease subunit [Bacteroidota bacterium]MCW5896521.1 efflux RND transporter permease subunit [Bacteroidota bacterium]